MHLYCLLLSANRVKTKIIIHTTMMELGFTNQRRSYPGLELRLSALEEKS